MKNFILLLEKITDPRIGHNLSEIVFIAVAAAVADVTEWTHVGAFAEKRIDHFKRYLELPDGIPSTPVPIKFSKNAATLIPMRLSDALRTEGASTSRVRGFSPHAPFLLRFLSAHPRNSVAPNSFTSYFVLRTSYLHSPAPSCRKVIAHHEAFHLFGTGVGVTVYSKKFISGDIFGLQ